MSTTTYVARHLTDTTGWSTRASATMAYTHAIIATDGTGEGALSWHKSEANAEQAKRAAAQWYDGTLVVVPVEAHPGGKAKVERALRLVADATAAESSAGSGSGSGSAAESSAPEPRKASAGRRAIPTDAANKVRATYLAEVGTDRYRNQYNAGWDAATAGQGAAKAASGTATVGWMDGWTDRTANPGKDGIASKWAALRSTKAPVAKVAAK